MTGLSDATNVNDYLNFVDEILPNVELVGRFYNNQEANSRFFQDEFIKIAAYNNLNQQSFSIQDTNDLNTYFEQLMNFNPDALLIGADNTMNLLMSQLADKCNDANLPLIGDSKQNTEDGALASIAVDYAKLSEETGNYVSTILMGYPIQDLEIRSFGNSVISLNKKTANEIGFTFPQSVVDKAEIIIE